MAGQGYCRQNDPPAAGFGHGAARGGGACAEVHPPGDQVGGVAVIGRIAALPDEEIVPVDVAVDVEIAGRGGLNTTK